MNNNRFKQEAREVGRVKQADIDRDEDDEQTSVEKKQPQKARKKMKNVFTYMESTCNVNIWRFSF